MALSASVISGLADIVDDAQRTATDIVKLTEHQPDMDLADGYAVQAELSRRWQADGRRLTGYKGGLTSKAKMVQMGLETPVFGVLMVSARRRRPLSLLSKVHSYYRTAERFRNREMRYPFFAAVCMILQPDWHSSCTFRSFCWLSGAWLLKTWNLETQNLDIFSRPGSYSHPSASFPSQKKETHTF